MQSGLNECSASDDRSDICYVRLSCCSFAGTLDTHLSGRSVGRSLGRSLADITRWSRESYQSLRSTNEHTQCYRLCGVDVWSWTEIPSSDDIYCIIAIVVYRARRRHRTLRNRTENENKILFTGCYFVTFISVVHSHILCVFLIILLYCMHLLMPYVLIKELT